MQALLRVPVALYRPPAAAAYLRFYSVARSIATEEKSLQSKETREEPSAEAASLRFYDVARAMATEDGSLLSKETRAASLRIHHAALEKLYHHSRKQALLNSGEELYPRIHRASPTIAMSISKFFHTFEELSKDTIADEWDITFYGTSRTWESQ